MLIIDLTPDQISFIFPYSCNVTQKVIIKIIRFAPFNIFDNAFPKFLMKMYQIYNNIGIEFISILYFSKNLFSNPGFRG